VRGAIDRIVKAHVLVGRLLLGERAGSIRATGNSCRTSSAPEVVFSAVSHRRHDRQSLERQAEAIDLVEVSP